MMSDPTAARRAAPADDPPACLEAGLLVDCGNGFGAGVQWHPRQRRLFWTDIASQVLWSCDEAGAGLRSVPLDASLCAFALCDDRRMLGAFADGLAWLDPRSGARQVFEPYMPDAAGVRMQDGIVDRQGRFVTGGIAMRPDAPDVAVWSVERGRVRVLFDDMRATASLAVSPDGHTLYVADAPTGTISACVYNPATGTPAMRHDLVRSDPQDAQPGGACVDAQGGLWVAYCGSGTVARYLPDGRCDMVVRVPVAQVTACTIGGDGLRRLFVTTAARDTDGDAPGAGGVFAVDLPVRGLWPQTYTR